MPISPSPDPLSLTIDADSVEDCIVVAPGTSASSSRKPAMPTPRGSGSAQKSTQAKGSSSKNINTPTKRTPLSRGSPATNARPQLNPSSGIPTKLKTPLKTLTKTPTKTTPTLASSTKTQAAHAFSNPNQEKASDQPVFARS